MHSLEDLEIGVVEWAQGTAEETLGRMKAFGVRCGQLGIPGEYGLQEHAAGWKNALKRDEFHIETLAVSFNGEDYGGVAKVIGTVGLVPVTTRQERVSRLMEVADFADELEVENLACHIGFVPEDKADPVYAQMVELVRKVCDHCAKLHQYFALETGQEPAHVLLGFLRDVERENLKVNFDPANMILYGTGNPIEALDVLGKYVISVHAKDGDWPLMERPDLLGQEKPLGQGKVDVQAFVSKLKEIGYRGMLFVEREEPDQDKRTKDIHRAVALLAELTGREAVLR